MLNLPTEYQDGDVSQRGMDLDTIQTRPSARRALIIDDDPDTVDLIKIIFRNAGMDVVGAFSGKEAIQKCSDSQPTVILLDLMMPDMDGWETYHNIRQMTDVPVIVVSADTKKENVVKGLNIGFDDYVTKPFSMNELTARIRAVLRRSDKRVKEPDILRSADVTLDRAGRVVKVGNTPIDLTPSEFSILAILMSAPGRAFSRLELLERMQGSAYEGYERTIDVHVRNLRTKIEPDISDPQYIETVYGVGYRWTAR